MFDGRAHHRRLNLFQHCFATARRKDFLPSDDDTLHPQAGFELGLPARLLLRQLIVMLHQRLKITPQWLPRIMHFLELIQPQQAGQFVSVNPVTLVPVPGDPGVSLRMRTNHPGDQRPDNLTSPRRQLARFQMHVDLPVQVGESFDQISFAGGELPVARGSPAVVDRYLMKITRPKVDSDVRYAHAEVLLSLINQVLECRPQRTVQSLL